MPPATLSGEPDAGNPHVRFDEGAARRVLRTSRVALLYSIPELEYCADAIQQANEAHEPTPWAADLLAQFHSDIRNPNPE